LNGSIEKEEVVDYIYLTNIWTIELCIRYCDICKDFRVESLWIYSRYPRFGIDDMASPIYPSTGIFCRQD
jgi:hypothetical protein